MKTLLMLFIGLLAQSALAQGCHDLMRGFVAPAPTTVSLLGPNDRAQALELAKKVFTTENQADLEAEIFAAAGDEAFAAFKMANYFRGEIEFYLAKDENGELLGLIGLHRQEFDADKALWITTFAVGENARGKGVGKRLIQAIEARARLEGLTRVRLYTNNTPAFESAQHLYEKMGYSVKETWAGDVAGAFDTYMREKKL